MKNRNRTTLVEPINKSRIIQIGYAREDGTVTGFAFSGIDENGNEIGNTCGVCFRTNCEPLYGGYTEAELRQIIKENKS